MFRAATAFAIAASLQITFAEGQQLPINQSYSSGDSGPFIDPTRHFIAFNRALGPNTFGAAGTSVNLPDFVDYLRGELGLGPNSQNLVAITNALSASRRSIRTLQESASLAAALTVIPPNPGDRYSVTIGGAAGDDAGAAAITATARINDYTLIYAGYARSQTQNMAKAGVSLSFK